MSAIAIIPAHIKSTTIPQKNLALIGGKPMVWWTINAAVESGVIDRIFVSTDGKEIADIATKMDAEVLWRPQDFIDRSATIRLDEIIAYHLRVDKLEGDPVVLLQPTSPFRDAEDIRGAMNLFHVKQADCVFSAIPQGHFLWVMNATNQGPQPIYRPEARKNRQQLKDWVWENGAIYITRRAIWDKLGQRVMSTPKAYAYMMSKLHSLEVDEPEDLELARMLCGDREQECVSSISTA